ncbi:AAA family ATPase [Palleronia abyssalis]|uniref:AAA family ATPase n=1 Tax=Palleronia abyssalis TaxID=1501240 RepID=UPI001FE4740A|nr:AAA family ATPase [Palleronia abyssalis]
MSDRFFVVTGGHGTGKTSLITELARRGLQTIPESGLAIIREDDGERRRRPPLG